MGLNKKDCLTPMQRNFVLEYLKDLCAKDAAIRAGYGAKYANRQGWTLLQNPLIQAEIQVEMNARRDRIKLDADFVLKALLQIADVDLKDAYDDEGKILPVNEMPEHMRKVLVHIDVEELYDFKNGQKVMKGLSKKIKVQDRLKALELLGRHLKLFTDKLEVEDTTNLAERLKAGRERTKNTDD